MVSPPYNKSFKGGDVIWVTLLFGGATIWVTNLFGGDAIWENSSTRKPNFGAIFRVQNGFKWKFQLSFSDYLLWLASMCRCHKSCHLMWASSWLQFDNKKKCNIENGIVNLKILCFITNWSWWSCVCSSLDG